ncbi:carboxy methyl transferase for protein phosphatase 2A [Savitreella phatthalungensis]
MAGLRSPFDMDGGLDRHDLQGSLRRPGFRSAGGPPERGGIDEDQLVSSTDDDALAARASAVQLGYLDDAFLSCFVKSVWRKPPLINRGTFVRTLAIDAVVDAFLNAPDEDREGKPKQVVSLGAGSDTRAFRLLARRAKQQKDGVTSSRFVYHEIDFPHVTQRKALTISTKRVLKDLLGQSCKIDGRRGAIESESYYLHPIDLRSTDALSSGFTGFDVEADTLVVSEVCLIYLDKGSADRCVGWVSSLKGRSAMAIYEPIQGGDAFGQMMVRNLASRGLELKTLTAYPDCPAQVERLLRIGGYGDSGGAKAVTTRHIHDKWLSQEERDRIGRIEMLDEVEEWNMLAEHYCVAVGWCGGVTHFAQAFEGLFDGRPELSAQETP